MTQISIQNSIIPESEEEYLNNLLKELTGDFIPLLTGDFLENL